jgi:hypothetical protein
MLYLGDRLRCTFVSLLYVYGWLRCCAPLKMLYLGDRLHCTFVNLL